ncbi:hypothetical protein XENTR_v10010849 [Xenopus tropicalis]|nr:hypothetical protein XENTR_v10010849 [Xenopus tropicalis]
MHLSHVLVWHLGESLHFLQVCSLAEMNPNLCVPLNLWTARTWQFFDQHEKSSLGMQNKGCDWLFVAQCGLAAYRRLGFTLNMVFVAPKLASKS